jgi:hypothetical protein
MGYGETENGERHPYSLNFDVLAHELGHSIIFSEVGIPPPATLTAEYRGFQESASDLIALISVLHFDSVVDRLLRTSNGDLYTLNELNRIGELSETEQIRTACNMFRMSDVVDPTTPADQLSQPAVHRLGEPLTGAIFDILVEVYQDYLVEDRLIGEDVAALSYGIPDNPSHLAFIGRGFARAYRGRHDAFEDALLRARDYLGELLSGTWARLSPHRLTFSDVATVLLSVDRELTGGRHYRTIHDALAWREINPTETTGRSSPPYGRDRTGLASAFAWRHPGPRPYRVRWHFAQKLGLNQTRGD